MSTYLVTGACGFIGSHVCEALAARGDAVVGVDNFDSYYDPSIKESNAARLQKLGVEVMRDDFASAAVLKRIAPGDIRSVIHLAALPGVGPSIALPAPYFEVNLTRTVALLDRLAIMGPEAPNLVLASTSSVYGSTTSIPFREDDPADRPLAPYAASKRAAEVAAHAFSHVHGFPVTVLRFFTVYGPWNRPDMMALRLARSIAFGEQVEVYDGGETWRDWTYVGDTVKGVLAAADIAAPYDIFNLGRGQPISLLDFIEVLESLAGHRANLRSVAAPRSDMKRTFADISKATEILGYRPDTTIEEGIAALWSWFEQVYGPSKEA